MRFRGFRNGERLPEDLAGGGIERDHAAAKRAALEFRVARESFFKGGERLVEHSLVKARRGGGQGGEVIHGLDLPDQLAGLRIERIHSAAAIAKEDRGSALRIADGDARAQSGGGLKAPTRAAGIGVERIDGAGCGSR